MPGFDYPQLGPETPSTVRRAVEAAFRNLNALQARLDALEKAPPPAFPSMTKIKQALQSKGSDPLNIQALLGVAAQAQIAGIPTVTALPIASDPITQNTGVVRFHGMIWVYDATTEPGTWKQLGAVAYVLEDIYSNRSAVTTADNGKLFLATDQGVLYIVVSGAWIYLAGIMYGTIVPDTRPTLAAGDVNFLFGNLSAGVVVQVFRWDGAAWQPWLPPQAGSQIVMAGGSWTETEEAEMPYMIPGPPGLDSTIPGPTGGPGVPGLDAEESEIPYIVPGPPGKDGADGHSGSDGLAGLPGLDGEDGIDGFSIPGRDGKDGSPGLDGLPGQAGMPGLDGEDPQEILQIPGPQGIPGLASTVPGPPGMDAEEEFPWIIPGAPGKDGASGSIGPAGIGITGPPGLDADPLDEPMIMPGPAGPTGVSPWSLNGSDIYYAAGRVGVGAPPTGYPYEVYDSAGQGSFLIRTAHLENGYIPFFCIGSRGTLAAPTAVKTGDVIGGFISYGYYGNGLLDYVGSARFSMSAAEDFSAGHEGTQIDFVTTANGGSAGLRFRIKHDGTLQAHVYGAGAATFDAAGNITSVSDERLKNIQGPFDAGLAEILRIEPILYKHKPESGLDTANTYAGFSSQNVMRFIPEAVGKSLDGVYTFNDRPVVAALVNAVKTLQTEIEELRTLAGLPNTVKKVVPLEHEERIIVSKPDPQITKRTPS